MYECQLNMLWVNILYLELITHLTFIQRNVFMLYGNFISSLREHELTQCMNCDRVKKFVVCLFP